MFSSVGHLKDGERFFLLLVCTVETVIAYLVTQHFPEKRNFFVCMLKRLIFDLRTCAKGVKSVPGLCHTPDLFSLLSDAQNSFYHHFLTQKYNTVGKQNQKEPWTLKEFDLATGASV